MSLGIKRTRPLRVIVSSFEGKPNQIIGELDKMYVWARGRNLRTGERDSSGRINLPWIAFLQDEEATTTNDVRTIDLWMPIDGAGPTQGEYVVADVAHENAAFVIHKGPMNRLEESIGELFKWIQSKDLAARGRVHRRIYTRGVDTNPEDPDWEAEIQVPLLSTRMN